jgi:hypothetical protein
MQAFARFALRFVPGFLFTCAVLLVGQCVGQEVDAPTGRGNGSVFAPTGWTELIAPVNERIDLKFYGFYIGGEGTLSTIRCHLSSHEIPFNHSQLLVLLGPCKRSR